MANKIFNMEGGKHSAAAYSAFENEVFGGTAVASSEALKVSAKSGMTVKVAKGNGLIDTGDMYSRRIQVSTDTDLTISTADTSLPRIDYVVIYVDNSVRPSTDQLDNTNNILKIVDIKGTPAASPAKPTESAIQTAIGSGNPYMILASIYIAAGATSISNSNITDARPASPNVYYAPRVARWTGDFGYGKRCYLTRIGNVVLCQTFGGGIGKSNLGQWTDVYIECPGGFKPFGQEGRIVGVLPGGGATVFVQTVPFGEATMQQLVSGDWNSSNDYQGNGAWFTNDPFPTDSAINL